MAPPVVPPIVKEALTLLPMDKSVAIRSYIAGLRDMIKDLESAASLKDAGLDPAHAHMHGHEVCHEDHGHSGAEHVHGEHCNHGEDNTKAKEGGHDHSHKHSDSCTHEKEDHGHDHGHAHKEKEDHGHGHGHAHKEKETHGGHDHSHGHKEATAMEVDDTPSWKKNAKDADPNAAPFGGAWGSENQVDATK